MQFVKAGEVFVFDIFVIRSFGVAGCGFVNIQNREEILDNVQ